MSYDMVSIMVLFLSWFVLLKLNVGCLYEEKTQ